MDIIEAILTILGVIGIVLSPFAIKLQGKVNSDNKHNYQSLSEQLAALLQRVAEVEAKNRTLEERHERDQQRIKQLEETTKTQQDTIVILNDTITSLKTTSAQKDTLIQHLEETSKDQGVKINQMQAQLDTVLKHNVDLAEDLAAAKDQLRETEYEKRLAQTEAKVLREVLDAVNAVKQLAAGEHKEPPPETKPIPPDISEVKKEE